MRDQDIRQKVQAARPKLSVISPLVFSVCWGYSILNLVLGFGMYVFYPPSSPPITPIGIAGIFSYQAWGVLFFLLGLITAIALVTNRWKVTRQLQLAGLLLKAIWGIALIITSLQEPRTILVTGVWLTLAYIQAMTYIHFLPHPKGKS